MQTDGICKIRGHDPETTLRYDTDERSQKTGTDLAPFDPTVRVGMAIDVCKINLIALDRSRAENPIIIDLSMLTERVGPIV